MASDSDRVENALNGPGVWEAASRKAGGGSSDVGLKDWSLSKRAQSKV